MLYTISVYKRFHGNALLLDSGGNLYLASLASTVESQGRRKLDCLLGWLMNKTVKGREVSSITLATVSLSYIWTRETKGKKNSEMGEQDSRASCTIFHLWIGDLNWLDLSLPHMEPDSGPDCFSCYLSSSETL